MKDLKAETFINTRLRFRTDPELAFLDRITLPSEALIDFSTTLHSAEILNVSLTLEEKAHFQRDYDALTRRYEGERSVVEPPPFSSLRHNNDEGTTPLDDRNSIMNKHGSSGSAAEVASPPASAQPVDWNTFDYSSFDSSSRVESELLPPDTARSTAGAQLQRETEPAVDNPLYAKLLRRIRGAYAKDGDTERDAAARDEGAGESLPASAADNERAKSFPLSRIMTSRGGAPRQSFTADLIPTIDGRSIVNMTHQERLAGYFPNYTDPRFTNRPWYSPGFDPGDGVDVFSCPTDEEIAGKFSDYVDFSVWGKYGTADYQDRDDSLWDDDIIAARTVQTIQNITDDYLDDHYRFREEVDERQYAEKLLECTLTSNWSNFNDSMPYSWTPERHLGVKYTDEVIEMKSTKVLMTEFEDPAVLYANDSFTYCETRPAQNAIGTMREQYDWLPQGDSSKYEIDDAVVEKIKPLLDYVNTAAVLQSTKVCRCVSFIFAFMIFVSEQHSCV